MRLPHPHPHTRRLPPASPSADLITFSHPRLILLPFAALPSITNPVTQASGAEETPDSLHPTPIAQKLFQLCSFVVCGPPSPATKARGPQALVWEENWLTHQTGRWLEGPTGKASWFVITVPREDVGLWGEGRRSLGRVRAQGISCSRREVLAKYLHSGFLSSKPEITSDP